jgi:hypothetical protein
VYGISQSSYRKTDFQLDFGSKDDFPQKVKQGLENLGQSELQSAFHQFRNELRNMQKIYHSCSLKIGTSPAATANNLRLFRTDVDLKISMLKKRSIYCIYQISKLSGFRRVDLHGLTLDEAYDLIIVILDHIYKLLNSNYQKK